MNAGAGADPDGGADIVIVVAVAANGVIGHDGSMPWHIPGDLKRTKALTMGKPLVMGRRTYQSIGRPLPGRTSIVLTRDSTFRPEGVIVVRDFDAAITAARRVARESGAAEIVLFGGAEIYRLGLPVTDRIHLTEIDASPDGDTRFPDLDRGTWRETARVHVPAEGGAPAHDFVTLERR